MKQRKAITGASVIVLAVLCLVTRIGAVDLAWDGSNDLWDADAHWLPGGTEPTSIDDAVIDAGTVTVDRTGEVAGTLVVGNTGQAILQVTAGNNAEATLDIADAVSVGASNPSSVAGGVITVGPNGRLDTGTGVTTIGYGGRIEVVGGGQLRMDAVLVDGGEMYIQQIQAGQALFLGPGEDFTVRRGGHVLFDGRDLFFYDGADVEVASGGRMELVEAALDVGVSVNAELSVAGEGSALVVNTPGSSIGSKWGTEGGGAIITVSDHASASLFGSFNLASGGTQSHGSANVRFESGASVRYGGTFAIGAGFLDGTSAQLTVTGEQTSMIADEDADIIVGHATTGIGTFTVADGATVQGGALPEDAFGTLVVNANGTVTLEGSYAHFNRIENHHGGTFRHDGGDLDFDEFLGDLIQRGGRLATSHTFRRDADIDGRWSIGNATYAVELRGLVTEPDTVSANEVVISTFASLDVTLYPGFEPTLGDTFTILTSDEPIDGTFANINLPEFSGLTFDVLHSPLAIVLETVLAGDYDDSGQVEQGDLDLVLQNWGLDTATAGVPTGWVNDLSFGLIDQAELDGVLLNWGNTAAPAFGRAGVPEPAAFGGVCGLAGAGFGRRRG